MTQLDSNPKYRLYWDHSTNLRWSDALVYLKQIQLPSQVGTDVFLVSQDGHINTNVDLSIAQDSGLYSQLASLGFDDATAAYNAQRITLAFSDPDITKMYINPNMIKRLIPFY